MTAEERAAEVTGAQSDADAAGRSAAQAPRDGEMEILREILFSSDRQRIAGLQTGLDELERRINDKDALVATITPVLGDVIRQKIREDRQEMIEALYPIIGQLVVRAVSEAVRDLARTVDAQVRTSFNPRLLWWRLRARLGGASSAEAALRQALPFQVAEVFLIHRETGLLLCHLSREPASEADAQVVGGMLTAIRDFAQDAFGRGTEAQLEEIEYGDRRILIEAAEHAYVAVVVDGVEPPGYRGLMRERLIEIEHTHAQALEDYRGDATALAPAEESLRSLMSAARPAGLTQSQTRLLAGLAALLVVCSAATCLAGRWAWRAVARTPAPVQVVYITVVAPTTAPETGSQKVGTEAALTATPHPTRPPTRAPSLTPTETPIPTVTASATAAPTGTPAPTDTPVSTTAPEALTGLMKASAWLFSRPAPDAARLDVALARGQRVEILAAYDTWCQVRAQPQTAVEIRGWLSCRWVEPASPIPPEIITPVPGR